MAWKAWSIGVGSAIALGLVAPVHAGGLAPDLGKQVAAEKRASPNGRARTQTRVIVRTKSAGENLQKLAKSYGATYLRGHHSVRGGTFLVPTGAVEALSNDPRVAWVSPDRVARATWDQDVETSGAEAVWTSRNERGTGTRIAILDSGIVNGSADWNAWGTSNSRVVAWKDIVNDEPYPYDDYGHGTHVAGIILGSGNNATLNSTRGRFNGTAPDAEIVAVKVLGADGSGLTSDVVAGIDWVIANMAGLNVRVINLSLGLLPQESSTTDPFCEAVRRATEAGIIVVCSAGNHGKYNGTTKYGMINCPGNEPMAITVGALNTKGTTSRTDDTVCTYSSRGPTFEDKWAKPDLLAPGNLIVSVRAPGSTLDNAFTANRVYPADYGASGSTAHYFRMSGTSMAAPQVAGVIVLMQHVRPGMTAATIKAVLMYTAQKLNIPNGSGGYLTDGLSVLTQGAGALNALGAVDLADKLDLEAAVGDSFITGSISHSSTIGGNSFNWSNHVLYGNNVYFGDDVFELRQELTEFHVLWGDSVGWDELVDVTDNGVIEDEGQWSLHVLWGDTMLWGDASLWGDISDGVAEDGEA